MEKQKNQLEEIGGLCIQVRAVYDCVNQNLCDLKGHTTAPIFEERLETAEVLMGIILEKIDDINKISGKILDVTEKEN